MQISDPMELAIASALDAAGIAYIHESDDPDGLTLGLDFWLPDLKTHIEAKRFHSERISGQMARARNVIAIQGMDAAIAFALMVAPLRKNPAVGGPFPRTSRDALFPPENHETVWSWAEGESTIVPPYQKNSD